MEENNLTIEQLEALVNSGQNILPEYTLEVAADANVGELSKYDTGRLRGDNVDSVRANNQSHWQAWGNAAMQAIGETTLGALEGAGYLLDAESLGKSVIGTEREFGNWFSDIMKAGKEKVREEFPIYGGNEFAPLSGRFWAKNFPSILSSLSLLIPTTAVVRGASAGAKLINAGNNLSKGAKLATKGFAGAVTSRMMENTMEASETAKSVYEKLIQEGKTEEEAKEEAGRQASNVWRANLINLIPDTFQYAMLFGATDDLLKAVAKTTKKKIGEIAKTMASEAVEEGLQYGIQQEAKADGVINTLKNAISNVGDYLDDDEFKTALLMGAAGGGVFSSIGQLGERGTTKAVNKQAERFRKWLDAKAKGNKYEQSVQEKEVILNNTPEENNNLKEFADEDTKKKIEAIESAKEKAENRITAQNEKLEIPVTPMVEQEQVHTEASIEINAKTQQKTKEELAELEAEASVYQPIPDVTEEVPVSPMVSLIDKVLAEKVEQKKAEDTEIGQILMSNSEKIVPANTPKPTKEEKENPIYPQIEHKVETELLPAKVEEQKLKDKRKKLKDPQAYEAEQKNKEIEQKKEQLEKTNDATVIKEATKDPDVAEEATKKLEQIAEEIIEKIPVSKEYNSIEEIAEDVPEIESIKDVVLPSGNTVEQELISKAPEQTPIGAMLIGNAVNPVEQPVVISTNPFAEPSVETVPVTDTPIENTKEPIVLVGEEDLGLWHPLRGTSTDVKLGHLYELDKNGKIKRDANGEKIIKKQWAVIEKDNGFKHEWSKVFDVPVDLITDVIRNFHKYKGPVYVITNSKTQWNSSNPSEGNFNVIYAVKVDGKLVPFDMARDFNKVTANITVNGKVVNPNFREPYELHKKIRKELFQLMKDNPNETVYLPYTLEVDNYMKGRHNNSSTTRTLEDLGGDFKIGIFKDSGQLLDNVQETLPEYNETNARNLADKAEGAVYILTQDTMGNHRWNRVMTKPLHEAPEIMQEIADILNKIQAASEFLLDNGITRGSLRVKKNGKLVVDPIMTLKKKIEANPENFKGPERFLDWVENYNDYAKELQQLVRFKDKNGKLQPDISIHTFTVTKKDYTDDRGVFNTKNYTQAIGVIDRSGGKISSKPVQIDSRKVNKGNYNQKMAKYLETNLNSLDQQFVAPTFFFGTNTTPIKPFESKAVKETSETNYEEIDSKNDLTKPFKTTNDGSGKMVTISTETTEKEGVKKTNKPKKSAKDLFGKIKKSDKGSIRFKQESKGEKEAIAAFTKWAKDKLGITPTVTKGLIEVGGIEAFGATYDSAIILSELAEKGTGFHEAFHLVFNNIFSKEERSRILRRSGVTPTNEQIEEAQKTLNKLKENFENVEITAYELAQEEILADQFRDYQLGISNKSFIGRMFQRIVEFINGIIGNKSEIERLFESISRGKYKNKILPKVNSPRYKQVTGFTETELVELTNIFLQMLERAKGKMTTEQLYKGAFNSNVEKNTLISITQESALTQFKAAIEEKELTEKQDELLVKIIEGLRPDLLHGGSPRMGNLVPILQLGLTTRGVTVSTKMEDDSAGLSGQISDKSISVKTNLTAELKRFLANQYTESLDSFGFELPISLDPNESYAMLQTEIGNSSSIDDMYEKLSKSKFPWINNILQLPEFADKGSKIVTQLYVQVAQKIHPDFKVILEETNRVIDSNRSSRKFVISNDIFDKINELDKTRMAAKIKNYVTRKDTAKIDKVLDYFFHSTVKDAIKKASMEVGILNKIEAALKEMDKGKEFKKAFNNVINTLEDFYPSNYQSAHLNVEGERVYEWMNSNFIGRQLNRLSKDFNKWKQWYSTDPMYANLPIFQKGKKLKLGYVDGVKYKGKQVGVQPGNFSKADSLYTMLMLYHNSGSGVMYHSMPIMGDSKVNIVVKMDKNDTTNEAINEIVEVIKAEYNRSKDSALDGKYKTHADNKKSMSMFKSIVGKELNSWDGELVKSKVREYIKTRVNELIEKGKEYQVDIAQFPKDGNVENFLTKFVADHIAAHSQLMLLTTGDFAFYKSAEDFYKRAKEIHSPGQYLNMEATYKGEGIPRTIRARIEKDIETKSPQADEIEKLTGKGTYDKSSLTDAQTYIDPLSYKWRLVGLGRWNDELEAQFNILKNGGLPKDLTVWQTLKPFFYNLEKDGNRVIPTQKKDSEFLIIPFYGRETINGEKNPLYNPYYKELLEEMGYTFTDKGVTFNEKNRKIDLMTFDTTMKVGKVQSSPRIGVRYPKEIEGFNTEDLIKISKLSTGKFFNEISISKIKEVYGEQAGRYSKETSSEIYIKEGEFLKTYSKAKEFLDLYLSDKRADGTMMAEFANILLKENEQKFDKSQMNLLTGKVEQNRNIQKLSMDSWRLQMETPEHHIDSDGLFGTQIMKLITANFENKELIAEYNKLLNEDIKRSFAKVAAKFESEEQLREMLKDEVRNRNLGEDYIKALDDKEFPLWHPSHYYRVSSILNSMFKKKVTKRKLYSGGSFINTSAHGFKKQPKIVWNTPNDPSSGINHFEAYAPIHNSKLRKYTNKDGFIDEQGMEAIRASDDAKLLEGIVYRVPTEDKYSMIPIKIIGFMPIDNGNIVLPHEITTVAGLDFDIDKMFGFFYASNPFTDAIEQLENLDKKRQKVEDETDLTSFDKILKQLESSMETSGYSEQEINDFKDSFKPEKLEDFLTDKKREKYQKLIELSKEAEIQIASDNRKLDIMLEVLRNPNTVKDILTPQGFDRIKKVNETIIKKQNIQAAVDVIDPLTLVEVKDRMNNGKQILGIYANGNAIHAILQQFNLNLRKPVFFDRLYNEFGKSVNDAGESISNNLGMRIGMAADNGKDPQASYYNANIYTADVEVMLLQLGVPTDTVQYFLAQPGIKYFVSQYFNAGGTMQAEQDLISKLKIDLKGHTLEGVTEKQLIEGLNTNNKAFKLRMLKDFLVYKKQAQSVMKFQQAIKSADNGAGVTNANNYVKRRAYSENAKLEYAKVLEGVYEAMASSHFMNTFMEYGIIKADDVITDKADLIKLTNGASNFDSLVDDLEADKGNALTEDEIIDLVNGYINYSMSEFYPLDLNTIGKTISLLSKFKRENPEHPLTSRLLVVEYDGETFIEFAGSTGMDELETNRVKRAWAQLETTNPELSKGLVKYSIWQSGMSQGFKGFSHLQPFEFHQGQLKKVKQGLKKSFDNLISGDINEMFRFKHQYIRNNFQKLSFVPSLKDTHILELEISSAESASNIKSAREKLEKLKTIKGAAYIADADNRPMFAKYKGELYYHIGDGAYNILPPLGKKQKKITRFMEYYKGKQGIPSKFLNATPNEVLRTIQNLDAKVDESVSKGDTNKKCDE